MLEIKLPDIGDDKAQIIEISVNVGDTISVDDTIIVVETEKASMDVPSSHDGKVVEIKVNAGDEISTGDLILILEATDGDEKSEEPAQSEPAPVVDEPKEEIPEKEETPKKEAKEVAPAIQATPSKTTGKVYASPSVRRLARIYGVDLQQVSGTGSKSRITKEDVQSYIKSVLNGSSSQNSGSGLGFNFPPLKEIDYSKFGEIEVTDLSRIQKISGPTLHRNWVSIPHVTQFDETDITDIEAFRKEQNALYKKLGKDIKISPIIFVLKAVAKALEEFPKFNTSLSNDGEKLIYKKYIHIGVAVDTPNGLVVPVINDVNKKGIEELSTELVTISQKARDGKLTAKDMQGGCFTISSLGGIGGTMFTPIINAPEVAILGLSKSQMKPVYNGSEFEPRLVLPLSLSYDHRVIDGADGARFVSRLSVLLNDIKQILL